MTPKEISCPTLKLRVYVIGQTITLKTSVAVAYETASRRQQVAQRAHIAPEIHR